MLKKKFNIRLLFEKIYKTSIPEKIREIELNLNLPTNLDAKIKSMIIDLIHMKNHWKINYKYKLII